MLGTQKVVSNSNKLVNVYLISMKRKPLNKSRLNYLKQNTPLNVVPEKKLKKADLVSLVENRGKSRFRTKRLRERVETLIGLDLVFKNKTNAIFAPHTEQLVQTPGNLLLLPQARNTLKFKHPLHLNMNAKRGLHLLVQSTVNVFGSRCAGNANIEIVCVPWVGKQKKQIESRCQATHPVVRVSKGSNARYGTLPHFSKFHEQNLSVEKGEIGTKQIVKRTYSGSTKMFSNTRFKVHSQDLKQLIEGRGRKVSPYKARLLERKKLSLIYGNLGWREIRKCVLQSRHKKGVASPKSGSKKTRPQTSSLPENLITLLESRLDVVLYRCRFFPSFSSCKQAINHGKILVNHRQVRIAGHLLKAGDLIQVGKDCLEAAIGRKGIVACPGSAPVGTHQQEHVVSKRKHLNLEIENEKQKTLLYFQNKIKSRPFSPFLPSALLTRFKPLHHYPWNTSLKPNQLNNTFLAFHNKQDHGSCFLRRENENTSLLVKSTSLPASVERFNRTLTGSTGLPLSLNRENQANSLFRDLKERKRILRTLSSNFNERLHGCRAIQSFKHNQHVTRTTDRLIKPLRNRDNPNLFRSFQSRIPVKSQAGKEHNTPSKAFLSRAATGKRAFTPTKSKSEHVLRVSYGQQTPGLRKLFPPLYRDVKPLNLEVSYQTLTAIFLFPPQKVHFPAHIDLEMIGKSI